MSTTFTRHQRTHTRPQPVDAALLATRCYRFPSQVSVCLLPIIESEAGSGDSCETAPAAGWGPAQHRVVSLSPARQEGEHRCSRPWTCCTGWLVPAVELLLLAESWTEPSTMRYLLALARELAALDTGLSFPVLQTERNKPACGQQVYALGSSIWVPVAQQGKGPQTSRASPFYFPQTVCPCIACGAGYFHPRSKENGEQIVSWLVTCRKASMSGG